MTKNVTNKLFQRLYNLISILVLNACYMDDAEVIESIHLGCPMLESFVIKCAEFPKDDDECTCSQTLARPIMRTPGF